MFKTINKKLSLTLGLLSLILFFASPVSAECTGGSVSGWAWSDNIGWISLSCENEGGDVDYALDIDAGTGLVSGYAWSEVVGWISFEQSDLTDCPEGTCEARKVDGVLTGWAKVIDTDEEGIYYGDYDEWVSLSGTADDATEYGVEVDDMENITGGYAWGDQTLGWVEFGYSGSGGGIPEVLPGVGDGNYISLLGSENWPDKFNSITFSAWIYWEGIGTQETSGIYGLIHPTESTLIEFEILANGELKLVLNGNQQTTDEVIKEEKWTHVSFTYEGGASRWARIYVDGENVGENQFNAGSLNIPTEDGFHAIGSAGLNKNFNGYITRIRLYHDIFE
ncbi:MAG: LamG-like jellyroll fold domain-containing protein [Patescibacteria group bacterium]|nr:LamG-like jellyroll fold domain-containing protein [Patescibacteria group bacterium]